MNIAGYTTQTTEPNQAPEPTAMTDPFSIISGMFICQSFHRMAVAHL